MTGRRSLLLSLAVALATALPTAAAEVALGDRIANLTFKDSRGVARSLDDFKDRKAFVLVFVVRGCPLVPKYLPTLDRLERHYRSAGVQFLAINVSPEDTLAETAAQLVEAGVAFPAVKDFDARCADAVGATHTPEVAVLDADRRLRYRGRIDDQFRPGNISRPEPSRHDLRAALDEVLAGKDVTVPKTEVDGCTLTRADDLAVDPTLTYAQHVRPILAKHCVACHRPGGESFPLLTWEQVSKRGKMVAEVVREGRMPPWFAGPGHDRLANQRVLTAHERDRITGWVRGGMAEGDRVEPPTVEDRPPIAWRIEPDRVLHSEAVDLPATGEIADRYLLLEGYFAEDTWVAGLQILPEEARAVRDATLVIVPPGQGFRTENTIARLAPGSDPLRLEKGQALRIPRNSFLAVQVHFVATGQALHTRVSVGLRFPRGTVDKEVRRLPFLETDLNIPPGDPACTVRVGQVLPADAQVVAFAGHLHRRGRALVLRAVLPDAKAESLLVVGNYHPGYQGNYLWEEGRRLPRGTRLEAIFVYDNSAFNPFNPDPTATVRSGPHGYQEACEAYLLYVDDAERLGLKVDEKSGRVLATPGAGGRH